MALFDELLKKEIEGWRRFAEVLRVDERELFNSMIDSCYQYLPSINAMGQEESKEAVLMALMLSQHKLISWLIKEIEKIRREKQG